MMETGASRVALGRIGWSVSGLTQLRIGVVGLGVIAQVAHLPNLARLSSSFRVTHLSDLSTTLMGAIAAALPGPPRTSLDARSMFDDPEVDAVLLLTPGAHAPLARMALEAGKHVISEKPLCLTQAEAHDLGRLASERGLVLQVAYMKAYDPTMPAARRALERIGQVRLISVEVRHPSNELQIGALDVLRPRDVDIDVVRAAEAVEAERVGEALGDAPAGIAQLYRDVLVGSVIHELSALRALGFQPPTGWSHATAWPFDPHVAAEEPSSLAGTATLTGGALLSLQWLWVSDYPRYEETISIVGSAGAIELDMPQPYGPDVAATLRVRSADGHGLEVVDGRHKRDSGFMEELRVFHEAVTDGGPVPTGAESARSDTASLQAFAVALAADHGLTLGGEASGSSPK
ncbi:MAG: Gfo/Idh/MocA family oxidoreductase [Chloroflexota bacterium]